MSIKISHVQVDQLFGLFLKDSKLLRKTVGKKCFLENSELFQMELQILYTYVCLYVDLEEAWRKALIKKWSCTIPPLPNFYRRVWQNVDYLLQIKTPHTINGTTWDLFIKLIWTLLILYPQCVHSTYWASRVLPVLIGNILWLQVQGSFHLLITS